MDDCKETVSSRHNTDTDIHMNSWRWWQHAGVLERFMSDGVPMLRKDNGLGDPSLMKKAISNWHWFAKEKLVFSNSVSLGILTNILRAGLMPSKRWLTQNKFNGSLIYFLSQNVLAIFVSIIFCLFIMVSNFCGLVVGMCLYVSCNFTFFKFWFVFVVGGGVLFYSPKRGRPQS